MLIPARRLGDARISIPTGELEGGRPYLCAHPAVPLACPYDVEMSCSAQAYSGSLVAHTPLVL